MQEIEKIRQLVEMMVSNDLVELSIRDGDQEIKLRRPTVGMEMTAATPVMAARTAPVALPVDDESATNGAPTSTKHAEIRSPMVGTFYAAPDPDSPPYVKPGDQVGPGTVVCVLEAMKVFSEIKAEISGFIDRILVKNGEAVEYGQPLFLVRAD